MWLIWKRSGKTFQFHPFPNYSGFAAILTRWSNHRLVFALQQVRIGKSCFLHLLLETTPQRQMVSGQAKKKKTPSDQTHLCLVHNLNIVWVVLSLQIRRKTSWNTRHATETSLPLKKKKVSRTRSKMAKQWEIIIWVTNLDNQHFHVLAVDYHKL